MDVQSSHQRKSVQSARAVSQASTTLKILVELNPHRASFFVWYTDSVKEKEIQAAILEYLALRGHFFWRNNSGAFKTEHGGFYRMGTPGAPDIIGCVQGKMIGIEVKNASGTLSETQEAFRVDRGQSVPVHHQHQQMIARAGRALPPRATSPFRPRSGNSCLPRARRWYPPTLDFVHPLTLRLLTAFFVRLENPCRI